jgi:hypothetical protein
MYRITLGWIPKGAIKNFVRREVKVRIPISHKQETIPETLFGVQRVSELERWWFLKEATENLVRRDL